MADPIRTLSIDALGWYQIVASSQCCEIEIEETQNLGTAAFLIRRPAGSSTPITRAAGRSMVLAPVKQRPSFSEGEIIAEIQAASGSMTFNIVEN